MTKKIIIKTKSSFFHFWVSNEKCNNYGNLTCRLMGLTGRIVCGFEVLHLIKEKLDNVRFFFIYKYFDFQETKKVVECVFWIGVESFLSLVWFGLGFSESSRVVSHVRVSGRVSGKQIAQCIQTRRSLTSTLPLLGSFVNTSKLGTVTI